MIAHAPIHDLGKKLAPGCAARVAMTGAARLWAREPKTPVHGARILKDFAC
jgi:hypothetical protein